MDGGKKKRDTWDSPTEEMVVHPLALRGEEGEVGLRFLFMKSFLENALCHPEESPDGLVAITLCV
jgi:hypothetical protein